MKTVAERYRLGDQIEK